LCFFSRRVAVYKPMEIFFKEIAHDYRFEVAIVSAGKKQKKKGKEKKKK